MEESRLSATEVRVHILVQANFVVLDVASEPWSGIMGEQYCLGVFACVQCLDYTSPLVFFPARNDRNVTILNESAQIVIAVEEGIPRQTIGTKPVTHQQVVGRTSAAAPKNRFIATVSFGSPCTCSNNLANSNTSSLAGWLLVRCLFSVPKKRIPRSPISTMACGSRGPG